MPTTCLVNPHRFGISTSTPDNLAHQRKVELSTITGQITGTHTNMPLLFTLANLPSEMFDLDGAFPANNGGGDIRFSSDSAGTTLLPCEVVAFVTDNNPANGVAAIWVKAPNVRSAQVDSIWCWYAAPASPSQPAVGAANGRDAVWSDYVLASHVLATDSTGANTLTPSGTALATGPFGHANGARGFGATLGAASTDKVTTNLTAHGTLRTYQTWRNRNGTGGGGAGRIFDKLTVSTQVELWLTSSIDQFARQWNTGADWRVALAASSVWISGAVTYDAGLAANDPIHYHNGVAQTLTLDTNSTGTLATNTDPYVIGNRGSDNGRVWDGLLAEFRIRNAILSANWLLTEYNSQNAPGSFITVGTPQSP